MRIVNASIDSITVRMLDLKPLISNVAIVPTTLQVFATAAHHLPQNPMFIILVDLPIYLPYPLLYLAYSAQSHNKC